MTTTVETVTVTQTETVVETQETGTIVVTGVMGPAGPQGPQGPQGPTGPAGGVNRLVDLTDVNVGGLTDEATLVYATSVDQWVATTQVITITKNLNLNTGDWVNVGISGSDLQTGSYFIQLFANDLASGGSNSNEYYTGLMSWYSGNTNSSQSMPTDEIALHRAGASGQGELFLRTYRSVSTSPDKLKLQIFSNTVNASAANYVFKFKRIM